MTTKKSLKIEMEGEGEHKWAMNGEIPVKIKGCVTRTSPDRRPAARQLKTDRQVKRWTSFRDPNDLVPRWPNANSLGVLRWFVFFLKSFFLFTRRRRHDMTRGGVPSKAELHFRICQQDEEDKCTGGDPLSRWIESTNQKYKSNKHGGSDALPCTFVNKRLDGEVTGKFHASLSKWIFFHNQRIF